jgi:CheY-like chemotaxis protein
LKKKILWVDDEIASLLSQVTILGNYGYEVKEAMSGHDALAMVERESFDLVLLDEQMPGIDGMETFRKIRLHSPHLPVVMVTKSEDIALVDEALGFRMDDFLIKPINPKQLLATVKRVIDQQSIISLKLAEEYTKEIQEISSEKLVGIDWNSWIEIHRKLSKWDNTFQDLNDRNIKETHLGTRKSFNAQFCKYIENSYTRWTSKNEQNPPLSVDIMKKFVFPLLRKGKNVVFILLDCMRLDQWNAIEKIVQDYYRIENNYYYSILPTATPYSRNAVFSGMFPSDMARFYPDYWQQWSEGSQNRYEREFLIELLKREGIKLSRPLQFTKILNSEESSRLPSLVKNWYRTPFAVIIINFIDILLHTRSGLDLLKEITYNYDGLRAITVTWFLNSFIFEAMRIMAGYDISVVITSDHGSIMVENGTIIQAGQDVSVNLRYKHGTSIRCSKKDALFITEPQKYKLPQENVHKKYAIAKEDYFFVYPTHVHQYEKRYRGTFQHGGISLEEMILPVAILTPHVK